MLFIEATSSENVVHYPDHVSEFEIHAALYFALKQATKADIRAEVKSRGTHGLRKAKTACRFDLVAFVNGIAICIIEVKSGPVIHKKTMIETRQGTRYPTYGIPVIVCYGASDIPLVVEKVIEIIG
jgi:hypothetical protein